jgi:CubicO group peptidase (beta-lactamase class C family)
MIKPFAISRPLMHSPSMIIRLLVCFVLIAASVAGVRVAAQAPTERYRNELQPLVEDFVHQQQIPGFAIGVIQDNRLVYAHGFGVKNLAHDHDPVTPRSLFHMASITKTFVATSIMQLVEAGKINLDAPVVQYLPYFRLADERYQTITVRQMVTHTSGIPDVEDYEWGKPQYDDGALERYVRSLSNQKLIFAPGTDLRYSNMAFEVLGDLIAKVSGESFDDYVQHHILTPLKMQDSTLLIKKTNPKLMTWGHERDKDGHVFPSKVYPYNRMHSPSSNLHSNVEDMARWAIANLNHGELDGKRILEEQAYDIMWKPAHKLSDILRERDFGRRGFESDGVGISWFQGEYRGTATVSHSGSDTGYATFLVLLPEKKIAVVLMANCDWLGKGRGQIAHAALDVALGLKPQPIAVTPSPR